MDSDRSGCNKDSSIAEGEAVVHPDKSLHSNSEKFECEATHRLTKSSSENDFQIDPSRLHISEPLHHNAPSKEESTSSQAEERIDDVEGATLLELEETFGSSPSLSQLSDVTHESFVPTSSPTMSPPIQVMERANGYDPSRISASVFSKPPGPLDWSVASNESLFSIQIGNLSFARDGKLGDDAYTQKVTGRSGDFDYSSEWYRSGELKSSSDLIRLRQPSPEKNGGDHRLQCIESGKSQVFGKPRENVHNEDISIRIDSDEAYSHADETKSNGHSCASPIKNSSSPPCLCTWCSCTFCSYEQLCCRSCLPKRPCCSNCKCKGLNWSSCCSCKSLNWPRCSCKSLCTSSYYCKWPRRSLSDCSCFSCHQRLGGSRCNCACLNWLSCFSCKPSYCCKSTTCSSCNEIYSGCSSCNCKGLSWLGCCSKLHCSKSCCNLR